MMKAKGRKWEGPLKVELIFDGGSRGNPGPAYGSYRVKQGSSRARQPVRLDLGQGTNNEAEYCTLIAALEDLLRELAHTEIDPSRVQLKVFGDSQLVIRQLQGEWKAKDARMRALRDKVWTLSSGFGSVEYVHQLRSRSVATLGH
jgi:ribonuclease HI